jgi:hypothetical protein
MAIKARTAEDALHVIHIHSYCDCCPVQIKLPCRGYIDVYKSNVGYNLWLWNRLWNRLWYRDPNISKWAEEWRGLDEVDLLCVLHELWSRRAWWQRGGKVHMNLRALLTGKISPCKITALLERAKGFEPSTPTLARSMANIKYVCSQLLRQR